MLLPDELWRAQEQSQAAKVEAIKFRNYMNKSYKKLRSCRQIVEGNIPLTAATATLKELCAKRIPSEAIVDSFVEALCWKPKYRRHLCGAIVGHDIPVVAKHYKNTDVQKSARKV